jgi:hypothetical protein
MKTSKNDLQEKLNKAQSSWRGKFIRDTRVNEYGLVQDVTSQADDILLIAAFPSNPGQKRLISLEPRGDLECLVPTLSRARYRSASKREVKKHYQ